MRPPTSPFCPELLMLASGNFLLRQEEQDLLHGVVLPTGAPLHKKLVHDGLLCTGIGLHA